MKKILVAVAVLGLAAASSAFGTSGRGGDTGRLTERAWGLQPTALKAGANPAQCLMTFITESIPEFTVGVPVSFQLEVCCGTPPYRFKITDGKLPKGLKLSQDGLITGVPREVTDTTVFIRLTDDAGCSLTQAFPVRTNAP